MKSGDEHILFFPTLESFFDAYGIGRKPHSTEISCMRLEEQSSKRLQFMPLFRANFFKITFFNSAGARSLVLDKPASSVQDALYFAYPGKLESWVRTGDVKGFVVYFTGDYLSLNTTHSSFDSDYPFFTYDAEFFIVLNQEEANTLHHTAEQMLSEIQSDQADRFEVLKPLLRLYLHHVRRAYQRQHEIQSPELKSNKAVYNRFRGLLDKSVERLGRNESPQPSVSTLANQLHLNPSYLNSIIKEISGKTASSFIQDRMLLEVKAFLMHTDLQVAEIAYKLGFENLPYFNRFFKKHTNSTPLKFRIASRNSAN